MTDRAFIWARESDGNQWLDIVVRPPQYQEKNDIVQVVSPVTVDRHRFARARLCWCGDSLSLLFVGPKTSRKELNSNAFENTSLLVPSQFGKIVLRDGVALRMRSDGGVIGNFLPEQPNRWSNQGLPSALDRRGWTLLVQRAVNQRGNLPRIYVDEQNPVSGGSETADVWLNPLVVVFRRSELIPNLYIRNFDETPFNQAIATALRQRHAVVAEMPISVQRRAIGWRAIWEGRTGSALAALFNREPAIGKRALSAPFMDLALLDAFGGTFLADRSEESGSLFWRWRWPDSEPPPDERQVMEHLCRVLGLEPDSQESGPPFRFEWGVGMRPALRGQVRKPLKDGARVAERLNRLAEMAEELPSGLVLRPILERFAKEARTMSPPDAERIFHPLLDRSAIERDHIIADEQALVRDIQLQFFEPCSDILVPFEAADRVGKIDPDQCFGTGDPDNQGFDPFRSPQSSLTLLREVVLGPADGAGIADRSGVRSPWYGVFWRQVAIGHNKRAFRLVGRTDTDRFVLDRSRLDEGRLAG